MRYVLKNPINIQYSPIEQILTNREVPYEQIEQFLNADEGSVYPPTRLKNMEAGAKMLIQHLAKNDKIFIQIDSDCDGFTSAALMINYLNRIAPYFTQNNVSYRVHNDKSHGLIYETIPEGTKLVIIPDAGSENFAEHEKCAAAGIDVLVIDHHEARTVPTSACIINNQMCDYPTKSLSGVGIVYKFCSYIDSLLGKNYADDYLDLVSLGLIADVMDTRDFETQYFIQEGLKNVRNPLMKELMGRDAMHFKDGETPLMNSVAWYVAPLINSITRVGSTEDKYIVFEGMLDFKAYTLIPSTKRGCKGQEEPLVTQACRVAANNKNHQDDAVTKTMELAELIIKDDKLEYNEVIMLIINSSTKNLNGLVANKLAAKYQRPVLVMQERESEKGIIYEGSARGYDKSDLKDFKEFISNSGIIEYAQGHKNAFGIGILKKNFEAVQNYCNDNLHMGGVKYEVDYIWEANNVPTTDVVTIASYKHLWGQKVEEPLIALEKLRLTDANVSFIGRLGKTLRIDTDKYSIIKFYVTDEEKEALTPNGETWTANLIVTCDKNEWNGRVTPQFKLMDIEIVSKDKWVF